MSLRRGFKSEANDYAREFRAELGLAAHAPLLPWTLAAHLEIPVWPLLSLGDEIPDAVRCLMTVEEACFSAVTVFDGRRRAIYHNDAHSTRRQASNIAHELAHAILGHPPTPPFADHGCRNFDNAIEDEANWLGPALLVSEEAALHIVERGLTEEAAARLYRVSRDVVRMRVNVGGARRRIANRRVAQSG